MNYKLAKQLKEAGFPNSDGWIDNGENMWVDHGEYVYHVPTLSELIEACGDGFQGLERMDTGGFGAYFKQIYDKRNSIGKNPKEAVANLWLKLNK